MNQPLKVKVVEERGSTSVYIDAIIDKDGDLILSGQDIGETPKEHFGDSDYEYWVHVPSSQKDNVLLALIEKFYGGNLKVVSEFMELMKSKGIHYEFGSWA
ncbi:MAG: hypothetical protein ACW97A_01290 [Candidatus Thorarchaeota archaeon]|jgi:hypothetical protein